MNSFVCIISICIVIYHATGTDGSIHSMLRQLDMEENNPNITQSEKSKLEDIRKTLIKNEILRMLGLSSLPNISHMPHLSKKMVQNIVRETTHGGEEVTADTQAKEVIVVAEPDSPEHLENSEKRFLRFNTDLKLASISSATLVLRNPKVLTKKKLRKHNLLTVRIIGLPHRLSHKVGQPKVIESSRNWVKLDVTSILKSKAGNGRVRNISVEVVCTECENKKAFLRFEKRRSFLIFNVKPVKKTQKRSNTAPQACDIQKNFIYFKDYGYTFIYRPAGFSLNYCKGTCPDRLLATFFFNRFVIFNPVGKSNPNDACCVVNNMRPLSIIYFDGANTVKTDVPNVIATDCHCV